MDTSEYIILVEHLSQRESSPHSKDQKTSNHQHHQTLDKAFCEKNSNVGKHFVQEGTIAELDSLKVLMSEAANAAISMSILSSLVSNIYLVSNPKILKILPRLNQATKCVT